MANVKPSEVNIGAYASLDNAATSSQGSLVDVFARRHGSAHKFEDLESQAAQLNLINIKDSLK